MKFRILEVNSNRFVPQYRYKYWPLWYEFRTDNGFYTLTESFGSKQDAHDFIFDKIRKAFIDYLQYKNIKVEKYPKVHKVVPSIEPEVAKYINLQKL